MTKKVKLTLIIFIFLVSSNSLFSDNNFFKEGEKKYIEEKYDDSKFLFQKSIVFTVLFLDSTFSRTTSRITVSSELEIMPTRAQDTGIIVFIFG